MPNTNAPTNIPWTEATFVAFDTETTGKYPLTAEICELAAVKWRAGRVMETFATLLKPTRPMGEEVIRIHGISNEMVANAPPISAKIGEFHAFVGDAIPIAHHAPFDLGFLAVEFERHGLSLPAPPVVCSSLLSRAVITESPDHKLQTLITHLGLEKGAAHRALDDAKACLQVALRSMERLGPVPLQAVLDAQGGALTWQRFSMRALEENDIAGPIVQAAREGTDVEFSYGGGSRPGKPRRMKPVGVVRSLNGDFFVASEPGETQTKRFGLDKVLSAKRIIAP